MKRNTELNVVSLSWRCGGKERTRGTHQSSSMSQMARVQGQEIAAGLTDQQRKAALGFSAFKHSQRRIHHLWEKKNRNSHDKALRVARGARESHHHSRGDTVPMKSHETWSFGTLFQYPSLA